MKFKIKGHAPYIDTFRKFKVTITSNTENKEEYLKGIVSGLHLKELIPYISKNKVITYLLNNSISLYYIIFISKFGKY